MGKRMNQGRICERAVFSVSSERVMERCKRDMGNWQEVSFD